MLTLVGPADTETVATLTMCSRMRSARTVLERMRAAYEAPDASAREVLDYGLCRAVYLLTDRNDTDKGPHQVAAVAAFDRAVDLDPGWWLPRFLRLELRSVTVGSPLDDPRSDPVPELLELAREQDREPDRPAYFLSTHAALLRARLRAEDVSTGLAEFTCAAARSVDPSPYQLPYLDLPFRESVLLLRHLGEPAAAEDVKAAGLAVFPRSHPLRVA